MLRGAFKIKKRRNWEKFLTGVWGGHRKFKKVPNSVVKSSKRGWGSSHFQKFPSFQNFPSLKNNA